MPFLRHVFEVLNGLKRDDAIHEYAVGGATAILFYAEPARTYDVDVFVFLPPQEGPLVNLSALYADLAARGFLPDREHVRIDGVPVQFLPAYNALCEEAVREAREQDYEGAAVRVVGPEHLAARALQTGGARRRERAWMLIESGAVDLGRLNGILRCHGMPTVVPTDEGSL